MKGKNKEMLQKRYFTRTDDDNVLRSRIVLNVTRHLT